MQEQKSIEKLLILLKTKELAIEALQSKLQKKETTLQTITGIIVSIVASVIAFVLIRIFS
ncbi:hypothetical protein [Carnobacterium maltaromaticum]|uniref:hypothetical protein n=1 Tax=Carnobacterium maltaromaticum TaxID=2751 RepID=UPI0002ED65D8|nr:hypothetical protein [Carnobacterium maltaromaticum]